MPSLFYRLLEHGIGSVVYFRVLPFVIEPCQYSPVFVCYLLRFRAKTNKIRNGIMPAYPA